jgi:uncharacterized protein (TIGR02147 family)
MGSIYNYSDYRVLLREHYCREKESNPRFSYRFLSQRAGINSPSYYKQVMEGTRSLTKATVLKTCRALKLKGAEAEYFENLVFFNQAHNLEEKNLYFEKIVALGRKCKERTIRDDEYEYFTAWYHCVVRELATMVDFNYDFEALGRMLKPRLTPDQTSHSVDLLLKLGFIKKEGGRYV